MDVLAISSGVVALVAAVLGVITTLRQSKTDARLAQLHSDLETEVHRRTAMIDRELAAEDVLTKYRDPLAAAAFDLQSRLYNILELDFLGLWGGSHPRAEEALRTTLFRLAQYFAWTEILRRNIQFLSFPEAASTQHVTRLQAEITTRFLSHKGGVALMIWSDEQRAIGERMIVQEHGEVICMGYGAFRDACETTFAPWCERLRCELEEPSARARLRAAQHALCELIRALDPDRLRYEDEQLTKA